MVAFRLGVLAAVAALSSAASVRVPAQSPYRNLQVLQDSAADLPRLMHLMRASLGTTCDFCHDVAHYEADTKPAKIAARRMIRMVLDLNQSTFGGNATITCNTCHRGSIQPVPTPTIEQSLRPDSTRGAVAAAPPRPTAADVLDRYIEAVGGRAALAALRSRAAEGTWAHMALGTTSDGQPFAVNRGKVDPFTVTTVGHDGLSIARVGFDGTVGIADRAAGKTTITIEGSRGLVQTGTTQQQLSPISIASQMETYGLDRELKLAAEAGTFDVTDLVELNGRSMNVLARTLQGGVRERFYFDAGDGLLRRRELLRPSLLGDDPVQIDFDDYRGVDGVRVPFEIKTSYLDDNHYGSTVRFTTVHHGKGS